MNDGKRLCLNMIVKNEVVNLQRCLDAVADHIECWVIGDTGSTDGTQDFIRSYFAARNLPGELHEFPFHNFEQARNTALDHAQASALPYDYILLDDADMELVVDNVDFRRHLNDVAYNVLQRGDSGLSYWNTRLVRRSARARYRGVTHEFLDVPGSAKQLGGIWYIDHASGSNRQGKYERDAELLLGALRKEPENARYWFYLAQSFRDGGRTAEAAKAYAKRADMGGWDEEAWNARLQEARCLQTLGDESGFVRQMLAAYEARPQRAESLYDLSRFYRTAGMYETSAMFSQAGLAIRRPDSDILFVEDYVYSTGVLEEFSIAANYCRDAGVKDRGFAACDWLALSRSVGDAPRNLAWQNLFFYLRPAATMMPSFRSRQVGFQTPVGYRPSNPSVTRWGDRVMLMQRTVNYTLTEDKLKYETSDGGPVNTRNFLLELDSDLGIRSAAEVRPPADFPAPRFDLVLGFEDARIFAWRDELWSIACVRELTPEGWCDQVLARISPSVDGSRQFTDWRVLQPAGPRRDEKNWMPMVKPSANAIEGERLQFIYLCDPARILDEHANTVSETRPAIFAERFRGSTQAIAFEDGWLALIHEMQWREADERRYYSHRFVWLDDAGNLKKVSRPFFFNRQGVEFAAGLAWHPDEKRLIISYGVADAEAWIATVDAVDVFLLLQPSEKLPTGRKHTI